MEIDKIEIDLRDEAKKYDNRHKTLHTDRGVFDPTCSMCQMDEKVINTFFKKQPSNNQDEERNGN